VIVDRVRGAARGAWTLGVETYEHWRDHRTIRLGAGLAYYGLLALVPLFAVALVIAGLVISSADIQSFVAERLSEWLGVEADDVALALTDALDGAGTLSGLGLLGIASLLFTASVLVLAVQDAFNTIWERPVRSGLRHTVIRRLVSFLVVAGAGAVIVVAFVLNTVAGIVSRLVPDATLVDSLEQLYGVATSLVLATAVIGLLLRVLPDSHVPWASAMGGGAATASMLVVGSVVIGAYLQRVAATSLVGATGSVFIVLLWIFFVGQIVLIGAEFTRVLQLRRQARFESVPEMSE
jgi:membrane protein